MVVVLALGIGANTAMFGIVYGMLIRPLPYPDSEALVRVGEPFRGRDSVYLTNGTMPRVVEEAESFEQLAAFRERSVDWDGPDGAVTLNGASVSPALFPLLRARPRLGRLFTEEEARRGADQVVLLSHRAWAIRFGSDPDIVGSVLTFADTPHTVEPRSGQLRLRHRHRRPADLRGGAARAGRRGALRLLRPGAPRDPDRADGGPALRVRMATRMTLPLAGQPPPADNGLNLDADGNLIAITVLRTVIAEDWPTLPGRGPITAVSCASHAWQGLRHRPGGDSTTGA